MSIETSKDKGVGMVAKHMNILSNRISYY